MKPAERVRSHLLRLSGTAEKASQGSNERWVVLGKECVERAVAGRLLIAHGQFRAPDRVLARGTLT